MQVVGKINDLHPESKPKRLEIGQTVRYKLLIGTVNTDPDTKEKRPILYPAAFQVPSRDRIYDPNKKEYVDIALVDTYDEKGNITVKPIWFRGIEQGEIRCTGGDFEMEEQYEHMELLNCNESNPNRNKNVAPLFKRVDDEKDSKERSKKRSAKRDALNYIAGMTNGEVKDKAASLGWDETLGVGILRDRLEEWAEKDAEAFLKSIGSKEEEVKTIIKKALTAEVISYDVATHKIVYGNQTLIKLDRVEGADYLTQAAEYILHNKNGEKVYKTIRTALQTGNAGEQSA